TGRRQRARLAAPATALDHRLVARLAGPAIGAQAVRLTLRSHPRKILNRKSMSFAERGRNRNLETRMALKVEMKPGERMIIGDCVITNSDQRTRLLIDGDTPILREKDILTAETANTPAKRIYLAVQLMYLSRKPCAHHETYFALMRDILEAAPSTWRYIECINNHILTGELYKALKDAKKLISYEGELLENAVRNPGLPGGREGDRK